MAPEIEPHPGVSENIAHRSEAGLEEKAGGLALGVEAGPGTSQGQFGTEIGSRFGARSVTDSQARTEVWSE